jgi:hypothetical protein
MTLEYLQEAGMSAVDRPMTAFLAAPIECGAV